jgi:hypothetical protein
MDHLGHVWLNLTDTAKLAKLSVEALLVLLPLAGPRIPQNKVWLGLKCLEIADPTEYESPQDQILRCQRSYGIKKARAGFFELGVCTLVGRVHESGLSCP